MKVKYNKKTETSLKLIRLALIAHEKSLLLKLEQDVKCPKDRRKLFLSDPTRERLLKELSDVYKYAIPTYTLSLPQLLQRQVA